MKHRPVLLGRAAQELRWYQRREFLQAVAAWSLAGAAARAQGQVQAPAQDPQGPRPVVTDSNIVELYGEAWRNGARLLPGQRIHVGDEIQTGLGSLLIFVLGDTAIHVRQNSRVRVEGAAGAGLVSVLRLLGGAVVSVWGKRAQPREIALPMMTAGIRGTGVYAEIFADQGGRGYLCNCYGTVALQAGDDKVLSQTEYHQSYWAEVAPRDGQVLTKASKAINHTDEELEELAALLKLQTAWQISGRKGSKDTPAGSY